MANTKREDVEIIQDKKSIPDVDEYSKQVAGALMNAIRSSSSFPSAGDDFDLYNSFPGFRNFKSEQGTRILKLVNTILSHQGLKRLSLLDGHSSRSLDIDDKTDHLVEVNDMMLERIGSLLDEASGLTKRKDNDTEKVTKVSIPSVAGTSKPVVSSWNRKNKYGKQQTFRLFHAHNIARPQLKFEDKIDNSNVPFVPKIKFKPNSLKPLPQALIDLNSDEQGDIPLAIVNLVRQGRNYKASDQSIYDHPYEHELQNLTFTNAHTERVVPRTYSTFPEHPCELTSTKEELLDIIKKLKCSKEIAVDLEHHSYRSFQGITCLMQISTRTADFLIDTLAARSHIHMFNEVFTDPSIVKVFHGADSDILWLQRDFGIYVVNMFDTGAASRELGLARHSLDFLLQKYCNVHANKKYQLADWRVRPLPEEMRKYAQEDTHYLLYVYDVMKNTLLNVEDTSAIGSGKTRLLNVLYRSKEICLQRYEKPLITPNSYLELYEKQHRKQLNENQLELLKLLYSWRDTMARQEDENVGYILPKHMLFQIAEIMPREAQGVLACCNPVPPLVRQNVHVIHELVIEARSRAYIKTKDFSRQKSSHTKVPVPAKPDIEVYDDILTCPHDLSHQNEPKPTGKMKSVRVAINSSSNLFKPCVQQTSSGAEYKKRKNVDVVEKNSWKPFIKFFPGDVRIKGVQHGEGNVEKTFLNAPIEKLTLQQMLGKPFVWKLRKTEKNLESSESKPQPMETKRNNKKTNEDDCVMVIKQPTHLKKRKSEESESHQRKKKYKGFKKPPDSDEVFQPYVYEKRNYNRFNKNKVNRYTGTSDGLEK